MLCCEVSNWGGYTLAHEQFQPFDIFITNKQSFFFSSVDFTAVLFDIKYFVSCETDEFGFRFGLLFSSSCACILIIDLSNACILIL